MFFIFPYHSQNAINDEGNANIGDGWSIYNRPNGVQFKHGLESLQQGNCVGLRAILHGGTAPSYRRNKMWVIIIGKRDHTWFAVLKKHLEGKRSNGRGLEITFGRFVFNTCNCSRTSDLQVQVSRLKNDSKHWNSSAKQ